RLGGDEFAVLAEEATVAEDCTVMAQRLLQSMKTPIIVPGGSMPVGMSIGIATVFRGEESDYETLMQQADSAMYRAKRQSGGFCIFSSNAPPRKANGHAGAAPLA
ncbi:MAG TPA: GGDEF domain-containing protein, partial [Alphaproteobacteria bacterium]|nr:GGDEF domain-containing protein [Alphaproteobacteria bacterium]